jgi:hypothetical protein
MSVYPSPPGAWNLWIMVSASWLVGKVQDLMRLSPSPWRARTCQTSSCLSQLSRRASRPNRPFHHRCTSRISRPSNVSTSMSSSLVDHVTELYGRVTVGLASVAKWPMSWENSPIVRAGQCPVRRRSMPGSRVAGRLGCAAHGPGAQLVLPVPHRGHRPVRRGPLRAPGDLRARGGPGR